MIFGKLFNVLREKGLTGRQAEVVLYVMQGKKNQVIADDLYISEKTVKFHLTKVFKTTGNRDRYALSIWAHQLQGQIDRADPPEPL